MEAINIIEIKEVSSTNDHLKKLAVEDELPEGFVVLANHQKKGRGTGTNTWESESGKNLTFSLLLRPAFLKTDELFMVSKAVSLGIIDFLINQGKQFTIKWPNDIYYMDKKVGGILIENQLLGNKLDYVLVGIGLNVNQDVFKSNAPNPISLKIIFKKDFNRIETINKVLNQINIWYEMLCEGFFDKINESYFSHLYRNTDYHDFKVNDDIIHAKILSVDNDGRLNLKTPQGEFKSFYFKEVEFVM